MDKLPILKYRALAQLWQYGSWDLFEGKVAYDASLKVMLRIEKTMQRLKVMEEDDRRFLWITPNPDKYACDDIIGNEIRLPYEHRKEIIAASEWDPEPQVFPTGE